MLPVEQRPKVSCNLAISPSNARASLVLKVALVPPHRLPAAYHLCDPRVATPHFHISLHLASIWPRSLQVQYAVHAISLVGQLVPENPVCHLPDNAPNLPSCRA